MASLKCSGHFDAFLSTSALKGYLTLTLQARLEHVSKNKLTQLCDLFFFVPNKTVNLSTAKKPFPVTKFTTTLTTTAERYLTALINYSPSLAVFLKILTGELEKKRSQGRHIKHHTAFYIKLNKQTYETVFSVRLFESRLTLIHDGLIVKSPVENGFQRLSLAFICQENPRRSGISLFPDRPTFCPNIGKSSDHDDRRHFYLGRTD